MTRIVDKNNQGLRSGAGLGSSALLASAVTAAVAQAPVTNPDAPPAALSDLNFVQFFPIPQDLHAPGVDIISPFGLIQAVDGIGPFSYALTYTRDGVLLGSDYALRSDTVSGRVSMQYPVTGTVDVLHLTVTDGLGATISKNVTVAKVPGAPAGNILLASQGFSDLNYTDGINQNSFLIQAGGPGHGNTDSITVSPPAGWGFAYGRLYPPNTGLLAGSYPMHVVAVGAAGASSTISADFTVVIAPMPAIGPFLFTAATISSASGAGVVVGQALASTPTNSRTWTMSGPDAASFVIEGASGIITVKAPMAAGSKTFMLTCTDRLATRSKSYTIAVGAGVVLPSTNLTMTVNPALDNYALAQVIGTPVVVGIAGAKRWSITHDDLASAGTDFFGAPLNPFAVDASTGQITALTQMAARGWPIKPVDQRGYVITMTCTDGVNACTQTFVVPVAWKAGPTYHVGQGMAAAHPGIGFEKMRDIMPRYMNRPAAGDAGATILVYPNADPDYYANDNGTTPQDYSLRYGWHGPVYLKSADPARRVRCGGHVGSSGEGGDMRAKGFFNVENTGDFVLEGFEVSYVQGADTIHGLSGVRKNAQGIGDFSMLNCYVHHCNNGVESGAGPYLCAFKGCVFANNGDIYVGSGATHGLYIGAHTELWFESCLSYNVTNGHTLKSRALKGTVLNSRLYDGERGSASCQIDMPNGGDYVVDGCDFQKGPNATNPNSIQMLAEGGVQDELRIQQLLVKNSRINMMLMDGNHFGPGGAIAGFGSFSSKTGVALVVTSQSNQFYLQQSCVKTAGRTFGYAGIGATFVETGSTINTLPIALDFTDPSGIGFTRPDWFPIVTPASDNYENFKLVQQDPANEDIRILASTAIGATICTIGAYGADYLRLENIPSDPRINPFGPGSVWEISQAPQYYSFNGSPWWAPVGRYTIITNTDGTGTLKVGQALASGVDLVKVRVTGPSALGSVVCDHRYYIVKT